MALQVNGYLAFKHLTDKDMTLWEFTNSVALAMCTMVVDSEGSDGGMVASTRGSWQAAIDAQVARGDPGHLPHALFNGRVLCLGGSSRNHGRRSMSLVPQQACLWCVHDVLQSS
jgi:hypothetical protein